MGFLALAVPILPGKTEPWRRFMQELRDARQPEHDQLRQRMGITREVVYLRHSSRGDIALIYLEVPEPKQALLEIVSSEMPFNRWFKHQLLEMHGLEMSQSHGKIMDELVLEWSAQ